MKRAVCWRAVVFRSGSACTNSGRVPTRIAIFTPNRLSPGDMVLLARRHRPGRKTARPIRGPSRDAVLGYGRSHRKPDELALDRLALPEGIVRAGIFSASSAVLGTELAPSAHLLNQPYASRGFSQR